jgi:hypothetical protein
MFCTRRAAGPFNGVPPEGALADGVAAADGGLGGGGAAAMGAGVAVEV